MSEWQTAQCGFVEETIATFPANALPSANYATSGPGPYLSGYNTYGMFPGPMPVFNALSTRNLVKPSAWINIERAVQSVRAEGKGRLLLPPDRPAAMG